jgi:DNA-binding NtrC family response regulator
MAIEALMFVSGSEPERLPIATPLTQQSIPATQVPLAVLVIDSELGTFRQCKDLFKDRGNKHDAKPLSSLLLGHDEGIPVIDGKYTTSGRLLQGIRALLENAAASGEAKAYVIGVAENIFREIAGTAGNHKSQGLAVTGSAALPLGLEEWPVPEELSKRFLGETLEYRFVRQMILRAKDSELPVLVLGETGTGKGVIARGIHDLGAKRGRFVEVNCSAIPSELLESELFGHVPGAFTGAKTTKIGLWELADHGTLFLDEIGDLTLSHQVKVLHTLQDRKIRRVGGTGEIQVHARIIAATNRNLYAMMQSKQFRQDLYYRLRQLVIYAPVLRGNPENIAALAQAQWRRLSGDQTTLSTDVLKELCAMRWPGNVRELNSFLAALHSFHQSDELRVEHIRELQRYFAAAPEGYVIDAEDPSYHRIECLRHLRQADEVVHACELQLKPLADGQSLSNEQRSLLTQTRAELQIVLGNRLLLHSQETYDAVAQLDSDLDHLLELPEHDARTQIRFWNGTMEPHLHGATGCIFSEVQQLMGEG